MSGGSNARFYIPIIELFSGQARNAVVQRLGGVDREVRVEFKGILDALTRGEPVDGGLFLNEYHAGRLREYLTPRWVVRGVVLSRDYMGVHFQLRRSGDVAMFVVTGIDDDSGRLFVDEFAMWRLPSGMPYISSITLLMEGEFGMPFGVFVTANEVFTKYVFGYDEEPPASGVLTIRGGDDVVRYRAQSEVVLVLGRVGSRWVVRSWFYDWITTVIKYYIANSVFKALKDSGFSVIFAPPGSLDVRMGRWASANRVIDALIAGGFKVRGQWSGGDYLHKPREVDTAVVEVNGITAELVITHFGGLGRVSVVVKEVRGGDEGLVRKIIEYIEEAIRQAGGGEVHEVRVGRHTVVINNCARVGLTKELGRLKALLGTDLPPNGIYDPEVFTVTQGTSVTIRHPRHGDRTLRFDGTYLLRVTTTRSNPFE
jgi:hypothetical protein